MTSFNAVSPVLPALNIQETLEFYQTVLGFNIVHQASDYGILERDTLQLHFWHCHDRSICEASGCRIQVTGIDALYAGLEPAIIHPNAKLETKPWGMREFGILDRNGNLITFAEDQEEG